MNKEYFLCLVYPLVPPLQVNAALPDLQRILRFRGHRPISHKEKGAGEKQHKRWSIPAVWGASRGFCSPSSPTIRIPTSCHLVFSGSTGTSCAPTGCLTMFNTRVNPQTQNTYQVRGLEQSCNGPCPPLDFRSHPVDTCCSPCAVPGTVCWGIMVRKS